MSVNFTFRRPAGRRYLMVSLASLATAALLVGCGGSSETPQKIYVTPSPTPTPIETPTPTATPEPTPTPTPGPCNGAELKITIQKDGSFYWQSGAGHKMATLALKNTGSTACIVKAKSQPLLMNGDGVVLMTGAAPGSSASLTLPPGGVLKTSVQTGNLCANPPIAAPVRVAFILPGTGLVIAEAPTPTDTDGVPGCLGDPSVPSGDISAQAWSF
jgi:hypothetical protein